MTGQIKVHFVLLHTGYIQLRQVYNTNANTNTITKNMQV